jgi:hypothetical protein
MIATTHGSTAILKCLVLAGADANIPDSVSCCTFAVTWMPLSVTN